MEEYTVRGKDYWPLYTLETEDKKVVKITRFCSVGPREVYIRDSSSDKIEVSTQESRLLPRQSGEERSPVSDAECLNKMIEEGKSTGKTIGTERKILAQRLVERLRLDDPIARDAFDEDISLEQLFRLHGLKATEAVRSCQGYTWW